VIAVVQKTEFGLYCKAGDFYIDPWRPVERALITHAHGDHARWGMKSYLTSAEGEGVLRARLAQDAKVEAVEFGSPLTIGDAEVTFFPAGHILGSSQIRIRAEGETWVISGDYKIEPDRTCTAFEPVCCDVFITESTFGLPVYRWRPSGEIFAELNAWWAKNAAQGVNSVIFAYSLGKAQRILSGVDPTIGPIVSHGAATNLDEIYRRQGIALPPTLPGTIETTKSHKGLLVIAPPSMQDAPWLKKFKPYSTAFASGWMAIRGGKRRRNIDQGFVLSDHTDWDGLLEAVKATGASRVGVTHGYVEAVSRYFNEAGLYSWIVPTHFEGDRFEEQKDVAESPDSRTEQGAE
jgi:putative mRNA 3-end processing factor